jgi:hypothetical protein
MEYAGSKESGRFGAPFPDHLNDTRVHKQLLFADRVQSFFIIIRWARFAVLLAISLGFSVEVDKTVLGGGRVAKNPPFAWRARMTEGEKCAKGVKARAG